MELKDIVGSSKEDASLPKRSELKYADLALYEEIHSGEAFKATATISGASNTVDGQLFWWAEYDKVKKYKFAMEHHSKFLLRIYGSSGTDDHERAIIFSEPYKTFKSWLKDKECIVRSPELLTDDFRLFLRDILSGVHFICINLKMSIPEISEEDIVFAGNVAKLKLVNVSKVADVQHSFSSIGRRIDALVQDYNLERPVELDMLLHHLTIISTEKAVKFLPAFPTLLCSVERNHFRVEMHRAQLDGNFDLNFEIDGLDMHMFDGWKSWSGIFNERRLMSHKSIRKGLNSRTDDALGLIAFSRQLAFHAVKDGIMSDDEVDEVLTRLFPNFLPFLHICFVSYDW